MTLVRRRRRRLRAIRPKAVVAREREAAEAPWALIAVDLVAAALVVVALVAVELVAVALVALPTSSAKPPAHGPLVS